MSTEVQLQAEPAKIKTVTIAVNGREETVTKERLTYEEIVAMAYPNPDFQGNTYKVTYFRNPEKPGQKPHEGTLTKGESIEPKDGMVFTVIRAVRS
jgi:hypothetical protein